MADKHMYRIDKFVVPAQAREEFLRKAQESRDMLRTMPGFVQDMLLEKAAGPGEFNIITIAEWESAEVIEKVQAAVKARQEQTKFNPQEMYVRLGIRLDRADYAQLED